MAKGKKAKLPKKIAGIRIPKSLRKSGNPLLALLESPFGRQVAADALVAVAGVLAGSKAARRTVAEGGDRAVEAGVGVGHTLRDMAEAAAAAVAESLRPPAPEASPRREQPAAEGGPRRHRAGPA